MVPKNHRSQRIFQTQIVKALENIYISPLETCNLSCKYCYTKKTKAVLTQTQILKFIENYSSHLKSIFLNPPAGRAGLKSILFCGGEVFLLPWFTKLINQLINQGLFITIITNGTIDKLDQIQSPQNCQLIVSIDGPQKIHDQNRGQGNYAKSKLLIKKALKLGFPVEIFYLVTDISYPYIDKFKLFNLPITYLTDRLGSLTKDQVINIKSNYPTYPPKNFGCFQLALQSNGLIYGCCESTTPVANISDSPPTIIGSFLNSLKHCQKCQKIGRSDIFKRAVIQGVIPKGVSTTKISQDLNRCYGCCQPDFLCGYIKELDCQNCQQVHKIFNS